MGLIEGWCVRFQRREAYYVKFQLTPAFTVVSAPIVGTTSLANLADIVGMPAFLAVSLNLISERK
jgi:hypothetical protein